MSKTKNNPKRRMPSAQQHSQSQKHSPHTTPNAQLIASLETQMAAIAEQIELLQVQSSKCKVQSGEDVTTNTLNSELCTLNSDVRIPPPKLDTPVLKNVMAIGSQFIQVSWMPVSYTGGYLVNYSTNAAFSSNVQAVETEASVTTVTLRGLQPNTIYYVRVQAVATVAGADSDFSVAQSAATGIATTDETAMNLQSWLDDLQTLNERFFAILPHPDGEVLSPAERRRLLGAGVRRYGYVDKVSDTSEEYPQFWPAFVTNADGALTGAEQLKTLIREIEVLRNLVIAFRFGARVAEDMLLTAGDDAFRQANLYYRTVRDATRSNIPEAAEVFEMLKLFWHKQRRITAEPTHGNAGRSPTERQVRRDFNALQRGTKEGYLSLESESDKVVKGKKVIVDNTRPKPRGGLKIVEQDSID